MRHVSGFKLLVCSALVACRLRGGVKVSNRPRRRCACGNGKAEPLHERCQRRLDLQRGHAAADAHPRPGSKRKAAACRQPGEALGQKAIWVEVLRFREPPWVAMDNPGIRSCEIASAKLPATDFHVFQGLAKENPDRGRTEPQALLDNSIQELQVSDVFKGGVSLPENAVHLRVKTLLNLRVGR